MKRPLIIILLVLLADQSLKFWIKTHMYLGQEFAVCGNWFIIHFTENNGMAFGMELLSGSTGKLVLSWFRILAVAAIGYYLFKLIRGNANQGIVNSMAFIFAGAMGNIIDSIFYGVIFSGSEFQIAELFPAGGGYAGWLHGKVVDMFYFPVIDTVLPQWIPFWGGEQFVFFRPVFNIADASISVGVAMMILMQLRLKGKNSIEAGQVDTLPSNTLKESSN